MAIFPANPSRENARACVLGVLISEIIVRIVTALPPQKPDMHLWQRSVADCRNSLSAYLKAIICQTFLDRPKRIEVTDRPNRLATNIGFRPRYRMDLRKYGVWFSTG